MRAFHFNCLGRLWSLGKKSKCFTWQVNLPHPSQYTQFLSRRSSPVTVGNATKNCKKSFLLWSFLFVVFNKKKKNQNPPDKQIESKIINQSFQNPSKVANWKTNTQSVRSLIFILLVRIEKLCLSVHFNCLFYKYKPVQVDSVHLQWADLFTFPRITFFSVVLFSFFCGTYSFFYENAMEINEQQNVRLLI